MNQAIENAGQKILSGVVGFFEEPAKLMNATREVRKLQLQKTVKDFDVFTPYPIHGLDEAQGLKRSWLPFVTFGAGLAGLLSGFALQYWTSAVDWPINIGGKPMNSWQAFVPVMFECTVLFAGLFTVGAMLLANGLPNVTKKAFDPSLTRDRFAIWIEVGQGVSEAEANQILQKVGATEVRTVFQEGWF